MLIFQEEKCSGYIGKNIFSKLSRLDLEVRSPEKPARGKKLTTVSWDPGNEKALSKLTWVGGNFSFSFSHSSSVQGFK